MPKIKENTPETEKKQILIAVLNWGLGHATRSIPLIRLLKKKGFEPVLASDGEALILLRNEFPELTWHELPAYPTRYPRHGMFFKWFFFLKAPLFLKCVFSEQKLINTILRSGQYKGLIADNRLGAWSKQVPSAYLTHQVQLLSGSTAFWTSMLHRFFIKKHDECWIPDIEGPSNLSGRMSHPKGLKLPVRYMGIYSRFTKKDIALKYDICVLLSGPEPQREILEKILLRHLEKAAASIIFIRGKIGAFQPQLKKQENLTIIDYLTGPGLEEVLNQSDLVIARSGYSSLLDLAALQKKAFFIPTPGQFEQQYLARRMQELRIAPFCRQEEFCLEKLKEISAYQGFTKFNPSRLHPRLLSLFKAK